MKIRFTSRYLNEFYDSDMSSIDLGSFYYSLPIDIIINKKSYNKLRVIEEDNKRLYFMVDEYLKKDVYICTQNIVNYDEYIINMS